MSKSFARGVINQMIEESHRREAELWENDAFNVGEWVVRRRDEEARREVLMEVLDRFLERAEET